MKSAGAPTTSRNDPSRERRSGRGTGSKKRGRREQPAPARDEPLVELDRPQLLEDVDHGLRV